MIKRVKKSTANQEKSKNFYLAIYSYIKQGFYPSQICSELDIEKQNLNYYISHLKRANLIKRIGQGVWETTGDYSYEAVKTAKKSKKITTQVGLNTRLLSKEIRGHAFQFKIKIPSIENWHKRQDYLDRKNIKYKPLSIVGGGQRIFYLGRKIWLTKKSVIIYERSSFLSDTAKGAKSYAIQTMLSLLTSLERLLGVSFKINKGYKFKTTKQHYARLKCLLAKQYRTDKKKLYVRDERGLWFWTDYSFNIDETETGNQEESTEDMDEHIHPFLNSLRRVKGYTPELVMDMIGNVTKNQAIFDANMQSHISAVQDLSGGVNAFRDEVRNFNINFSQISPTDYLKANIHSLTDIFKPEISQKIKKLSSKDRRVIELWLIDKYGGK